MRPAAAMVLSPACCCLHCIVCCSVQEKIEAIAVGTYGAAGVSYSPEAEEAIQVGSTDIILQCHGSQHHVLGRFVKQICPNAWQSSQGSRLGAVHVSGGWGGTMFV